MVGEGKRAISLNWSAGGNAKLIAAERRFGHVKEIARVQSAVA